MTEVKNELNPIWIRTSVYELDSDNEQKVFALFDSPKQKTIWWNRIKGTEVSVPYLEAMVIPMKEAYLEGWTSIKVISTSENSINWLKNQNEIKNRMIHSKVDQVLELGRKIGNCSFEFKGLSENIWNKSIIGIKNWKPPKTNVSESTKIPENPWVTKS